MKDGKLIYALKFFVPKVWTDGCKNIPVAGESLAVVNFYDNICQLCFIVQGFELLKDVAGVHSIYPVVVGGWRRPILYL